MQDKAEACPTCKPMQARQQAAPPPQQQQHAQPQPQQLPSNAAQELSGSTVPEFDLENVDWDALEKLAVEVGGACHLSWRARCSMLRKHAEPHPMLRLAVRFRTAASATLCHV